MASVDVSEDIESKKRKLEETGSIGGTTSGDEDKSISDDEVSDNSDDEDVSETKKENCYSSDTDEELVKRYEMLSLTEFCVEDSVFDNTPFENEEHKENHRRYFKQIADSEGFDVDFFPKEPMFFGGFVPVNFKKFYTDKVNHCLNYAINQENQKLGATASLELVDIVKVVNYAPRPLTFLITFNAKDSQSGEQKTYQTKVICTLSGRTRVRIFREKPKTP